MPGDADSCHLNSGSCLLSRCGKAVGCAELGQPSQGEGQWGEGSDDLSAWPGSSLLDRLRPPSKRADRRRASRCAAGAGGSESGTSWSIRMVSADVSTEYFFPTGSMASEERFATETATKFEPAGAMRVFDSGDIVIDDLSTVRQTAAMP